MGKYLKFVFSVLTKAIFGMLLGMLLYIGMKNVEYKDQDEPLFRYRKF